MRFLVPHAEPMELALRPEHLALESLGLCRVNFDLEMEECQRVPSAIFFFELLIQGTQLHQGHFNQ